MSLNSSPYSIEILYMKGVWFEFNNYHCYLFKLTRRFVCRKLLILYVTPDFSSNEKGVVIPIICKPGFFLTVRVNIMCMYCSMHYLWNCKNEKCVYLLYILWIFSAELKKNMEFYHLFTAFIISYVALLVTLLMTLFGKIYNLKKINILTYVFIKFSQNYSS